MDVMVFLLRVLLLTGFLELSGFFEWAAAHIVRRAHSRHAMTPIGNPQHMLIAVASGIHFARFVLALALPSIGGLAMVYAVIAFVYRRDLREGKSLGDESALPPIDRALVP